MLPHIARGFEYMSNPIILSPIETTSGKLHENYFPQKKDILAQRLYSGFTKFDCGMTDLLLNRLSLHSQV